MFSIRLLTGTDGAAYQALRLESLQKNPEAFLTTYEEECKLHEDAFSSHLDAAYHPPYFGYFGIWVDVNGNEELAGYIQLSQNYLDKQSHIGLFTNLYFSPRFRGQGLATALFEHIFRLVMEAGKIERLYLTCTAQNKPALAFYKKLGFRRYAVKVKAIKYGSQYDDEIELVKVV